MAVGLSAELFFVPDVFFGSAGSALSCLADQLISGWRCCPKCRFSIMRTGALAPIITRTRQPASTFTHSGIPLYVRKINLFAPDRLHRGQKERCGLTCDLASAA